MHPWLTWRSARRTLLRGICAGGFLAALTILGRPAQLNSWLMSIYFLGGMPLLAAPYTAAEVYAERWRQPWCNRDWWLVILASLVAAPILVFLVAQYHYAWAVLETGSLGEGIRAVAKLRTIPGDLWAMLAAPAMLGTVTYGVRRRALGSAFANGVAGVLLIFPALFALGDRIEARLFLEEETLGRDEAAVSES